MKARALRAQLMRASLLTTAAALLLSAGLMLGYEYFSFRGERERDLRAQAELVARAVVPALLFSDAKSAELHLGSLRAKPGVRRAVVYDMTGSRFAAFKADGGSPEETPSPLPWNAAATRHAGSTLELVYPVDHDGERVGMVYLMAQHDIAARIANYAAILSGVVLAGLALAWIVFGRLQRVVTDPLSAVTRVAQQVMDQRDWRLRAPVVTSSEEIQVLVDSFNGMLTEMEAAQAQLLAADRKKDVFLATLAHELRNPLAPMTNAVHMLQRPTLAPAMREKSHDILARQLRHVVRLIDDLLDVSRVATGKLTLQPEQVDMTAIVKAAVELIEPVARDRRLLLKAHLPQVPCPVLGDSARLQQVFSNLLTNACRYTPADGRIDVTLEVVGEQVSVSVSDTGIGIEPSMQQAVFELFEQVDKRLERGNTGLGIGLTLARQLVLLHGGTLSLTSEGAGRGSRFTVTLPRVAEAALVAGPGDPVTPSSAGSAGLSLLIADDNIDFALSMQAILELQGYEVQVVNDGELALKTCLTARKDVAILDIGMPGLNGYDVAARLRDAPGRPRVLIAASGWGRLEDKAKAQAAGFDHHLTKPFEFDQLIALLETVQTPLGTTARPDAIFP